MIKNAEEFWTWWTSELKTWFTSGKNEILTAIGQIDIPTDDLATKANQQKMMVNFNMADEMPELVALTDTEIQDTCDEIWEQVVPNDNANANDNE